MDEQWRKSLEFRELIFQLYGFTPNAQDFIRQNSTIFVRDPTDTGGGGGWRPWDQTVELNGVQHEAAVHELSHVWWHWFRLAHPDMRRELARDVVKLSEMNPLAYSQYTEAIQFARGYVHGIGDWIGMYGNNEFKTRVKDIHNLTESDFESLVIDWEIFAGFCSWTMGCYKTGPRVLPKFMWQYFEPLFSGAIKIVPYYLGGHP